MTIKNRLMPLVARLITSPGLRSLKRQWFELRRGISNRPATATFYFRADDPYSWLLAQQLPEFCRRFQLQIQPRVMLGLPEEMYPEPALYRQWCLDDAPLCARLHNLTFPEHTCAPDRKAVMAVTRILLAQENEPGFLSIAQTLSRKLWEGQLDEIYAMATHTGVMDERKAEALLEERKQGFLGEGHYLTGTLHYGGEWYWGPDRLDHLAERLGQVTGRTDIEQWLTWRSLSLKPASHARGNTLELFFSFRSPYSYLALDRVYRLARHYGLALKIRPVLPMVMRGLAVPKAKRFYILTDAAREAHRAHVPFGKVCDPVGAGVERCMALWPYAEKREKLSDFVFNAATAIWSQGVDVASDKGLRAVVEETGLDWTTAQKYLADDSWRSQADANREEMMAAGNWGVPSLRYQDTMLWGQDRIPLLEQLILNKE